MKQLTEDEFYNQFTLVKNHLENNAAFDGCMYETYGEELEYIFQLAKKENRVWTIIEGDRSDRVYYATGFHYVNRLGFLITEEIYFEDMEAEIE